MGANPIATYAEFGQLSLQPTTSGFAEPAATATEATAMEAVAMNTDPPEDPLSLLLECPVLEDDNILVDNYQSMPTPAEMVELVTFTLQMDVDLPATLTLFWVYNPFSHITHTIHSSRHVLLAYKTCQRISADGHIYNMSAGLLIY